MKRIVLALIFVLISFSAVSSQPKVGKAQPSGTVRVAAIDFGYVFKKYEKASRFKKDLEDAKAPFEKQTQRHKDNIANWQKAIRARDFADATEAELKAKIAAAEKELARLTADLTREFGKIQEEKLVLLWKDVQDAIATYAAEHKIRAVLGYGEPMEKIALDQFPNINRKMQAMDSGSTVPLYLTGPADISKAVTAILNKRPPAKSAQPVPAGTDRIAIVNIGFVFNKYKRAIAFKTALEETIAPYKRAAAVHRDNIAACEEAIRKGDFTVETEEQLKAKLAVAKQQLDDLTENARRVLGKKQEDSLVQLWKEVQGSIKTYADQHGIDMVLGFGDPLDRQIMDLFPNINRKMQAMDAGGTAPLFASPKMDIAVGVTALLNEQVDEKNEIIPVQASAEKAQPVSASRVSFINVGYVFNNYSRAQAFKKELEDIIGPFKKKWTDLSADGEKWQSALDKRDFSVLTEEELRSAIRKKKSDLEDVRKEMDRALGKKQEENLVTLWKEMQLANSKVATAYGFDLLIGHGDPLDKKLLNAFDNVNRKMQAMDAGNAVALFVAPVVNLDEAVTGTLNIWAGPPVKERREAPPGDPR